MSWQGTPPDYDRPTMPTCLASNREPQAGSSFAPHAYRECPQCEFAFYPDMSPEMLAALYSDDECFERDLHVDLWRLRSASLWIGVRSPSTCSTPLTRPADTKLGSMLAGLTKSRRTFACGLAYASW